MTIEIRLGLLLEATSFGVTDAERGELINQAECLSGTGLLVLMATIQQ